MKTARWWWVWLGLAAAVAVGQERKQEPGLLLADSTRPPRVVVTWPTAGGKVVRLEGERGYKSPEDRTPLGKNIECYVALGGTRMEKGRGDPHGAVLRVGLHRADEARLFFEDIAEGGEITVRLEGVWMNQPVRVAPGTGLMQERYKLGDLAACGIDGGARTLVVTSDAKDPVLGSVKPENARPGGLDGVGPGHGSVEAKVEADGSVTMEFKFPYPMLRHIKDPYQRTKPGAFFEPTQFHVEVEVVAGGGAVNGER